jgi:hypothetical protein
MSHAKRDKFEQQGEHTMASSGLLSRAAAALSSAVATSARPVSDQAAHPSADQPRTISVDLPKVFEKLPRSCIAMLEDVFQERAEAGATYRLLADQITDARDRRETSKTQRSDLMDRGRTARPLAADDPMILNLDNKIAGHSALLERLRPRQELVSLCSSNSSYLLNNIEIYVKRLDRVKDAQLWNGAAPVGLKKGESLPDAIERDQRRVRELEADANQVRAAPLPSSTVIDAEIERINALAQKGVPDAMAAIERGEALQWPTVSSMISSSLGGETPVFGNTEAPDVIAILAALFRERMIELAKTAILRDADDDAALSMEERAKRIAQIERDKLATERDEVALIRQAKAQNQPITFRPDTDPRAFLGLGDDFPAPRPQ